jgi:hypothetical protein
MRQPLSHLVDRVIREKDFVTVAYGSAHVTVNHEEYTTYFEDCGDYVTTTSTEGLSRVADKECGNVYACLDEVEKRVKRFTKKLTKYVNEWNYEMGYREVDGVMTWAEENVRGI